MTNGFEDPEGTGRAPTAALMDARTDRDSEARRWLLGATDDPRTAVRQWGNAGVALARCGLQFSAARLDGPLVWAAAGTEDSGVVADYLAAELGGGPVFADAAPYRYYALMPAAAATWREWPNLLDGRDDAAQLLSDDHFLGVPAPWIHAADKARSWWIHPYGEEGHLCSAEGVAHIVVCGRLALARRAEEGEG